MFKLYQTIEDEHPEPVPGTVTGNKEIEQNTTKLHVHMSVLASQPQTAVYY